MPIETNSPEIKPHVSGQPIFSMSAKNARWGKDGFFNKWHWENWMCTCKATKASLNLTPYPAIELDYRSKRKPRNCETRRKQEESISTLIMAMMS